MSAPIRTESRAREKHRDHNCLIRSASLSLPNSQAFNNPCSLRSMFFTDAISWVGGLLTRLEMMTGSVSRMMPSSMISSTARERMS